MYCWGVNTWGELGVVPATTTLCGQYGYGQQPCITKPTRVTASATVNGVVTNLTTATTIRAGGDHTCALGPGGVAWCWGTNWYGEAGDGNGAFLVNAPTPTPVAGGLSFTSIDVGGFQTCGTSSSQIFCWGQVRFDKPQHLTPFSYSNWWGWGTGISVGDNNVCARSAAGSWSCFGDNRYGQLGLDPAIWPYFDAPLGLTATNTAPRVEAGHYTTCADEADGTVQCWGDNSSGQLGVGSFDSFSFNPQTVGGGLQLHGVTLGTNHACALDPNGLAFCWGSNSLGQIGNGSVGGAVRSPVQVSTSMTFRALAAGSDHTCGIGTDNHFYCWGDNFKGQLGQPIGAPLHGQLTPIQTQDP